MANKRTLKKQIDFICEELFVDFVAASHYGNNPSKEEAEAILFSLAKLHNNYINRVSHPEPGMPAKKYYQDLRDQFHKQATEIIDQINNF